MDDKAIDVDRNWRFMLRFLPEDFEQQAFRLGALRRRRKIPDAATLLRVLLIHAAEGLSLRETAVRCRETGIADLTDVAILYRLRVSADWTAHLCAHLAAVLAESDRRSPPARRLLAVDATNVRETGPTGGCWRLHYMLDLATSRCAACEITSSKGAEKLGRFAYGPGDLVFADRGYSRAPDVLHVLDAGGDVVLRYKHRSMKLFDAGGERLDTVPLLAALPDGAVGDYAVAARYGKREFPGRLCAVRKSPEAIAREQRRIHDRRRRKMTRNGRPETLAMAAYFVVFTTEPAARSSAEEILRWYAWRWQVEIAFKRLKGIFDLGHLPKHDPECILAWMQLKLLTALWVECLRRHAESFSPWGYPLRPGRPIPLPVAGTEHA